MNSNLVTAIQNNKGKLIGTLVGGVTNTFEVEGETFFEGKNSSYSSFNGCRHFAFYHKRKTCKGV